jgi:hypothetical protein
MRLDADKLQGSPSSRVNRQLTEGEVGPACPAGSSCPVRAASFSAAAASPDRLRGSAAALRALPTVTLGQRRE